MKGHFHIALTRRPIEAGSVPAIRLSAWSRFKLLLAGLAMLLVTVTVMALALLLGSVLAAILWSLLALLLSCVILTSTWRSLRR